MVNVTFKTAEKVLELLKQRQIALTRSQIAQTTKIGWPSVSAAIIKLDEYGYVNVMSNGKTQLIEAKVTK